MTSNVNRGGFRRGRRWNYILLNLPTESAGKSRRRNRYADISAAFYSRFAEGADNRLFGELRIIILFAEVAENYLFGSHFY